MLTPTVLSAMPAPRQRGTKVHDQPSDPNTRTRHQPSRFHNNANPIREPNNPPIPTADASRPTMKQTHHLQPVHSEQDAEYINIKNHSDVGEDDNEEVEESVEQPIPRARAPWGQALPSPMGTVNSIDPLDSTGKGSDSTRDVCHFFEKTSEASTCRICR